MIRRILVPLDGSALAEAILPSVEEIARLAGATVIILHVVDPLQPHDEVAGSGPVDIRQELNLLETRAQDYLTHIAGRLSAAGLASQPTIVPGPAAQTIIRLGANADLIAMATHGRSGLSRLVFGSVADAVVRGATTPVLLVRAHVREKVAAPVPAATAAPGT
jgi:nucleotide-binding universal stress UspA family protein